jgi:hypothetical protein
MADCFIPTTKAAVNKKGGVNDLGKLRQQF